MNTRTRRQATVLAMAGILALGACSGAKDKGADQPAGQNPPVTVQQTVTAPAPISTTQGGATTPSGADGGATSSPAGAGTAGTSSNGSSGGTSDAGSSSGGSSQACSEHRTQQQAFQSSVKGLEPPTDGHGPWSIEDSGTTTYDPCATLSWIVVSPQQAHVTSRTQILLFHEGRYIGTTLAKPQTYRPVVTRDSPGRITVKYRWLTGNEPNCCPTGASTAHFEYRDGKVVQTGKIPPQE